MVSLDEDIANTLLDVISNLLAAAKRPIHEALHLESIPEHTTRGSIAWTRGQWLRAMQLISQGNGIVTYQKMLDEIFPSSIPLDSLVNYGLVYYRPTHVASVSDNIYDPAITVPNHITLKAIRDTLSNLPKPCTYSRKIYFDVF
jgi:hypothetical protein